MEEEDSLFRKGSLDLLNSPEQLDRLLKVVRPKGWIALLFLLAIVAAVVIWSIVGSIPVVTRGRGIVYDPSSVFLSVPTMAEGRISEIRVKYGDEVKEGEILFVLKNPGLEMQIDEAKLDCKAAQEELAQISHEVETANKRRKEFLKKRIEIEKELLKEQEKNALTDPKTQSAVLERRALIISLEEEMATDLDTDRVDAQKRALQMANLKLRELNLMQEELTIRATERSDVIDVPVVLGQYVNVGDVLAWLEAPKHDAPEDHIFAFVPLYPDRIVQKGMFVEANIDGVNPVEYGLLKGEIIEVLPYTTSASYIERLRALPSTSLIEYLKSMPIAVPIIIKPDMDAKTGSYVWTRRIGRPSEFNSGALCNVTVYIEQKKPISYLIPPDVKEKNAPAS